MKKISAILILFMFASLLIAGENVKITEVGVTSTRPLYNSYNFTVKMGNEASVLRLSTLTMSEYIRDINYVSSDGIDTLYADDTDKYFELAFAVGREYRKLIADNFEFRYGADFIFAYSHDKEDYDNDVNYTRYSNKFSIVPGFRLVVGANYVIKDKFIIGIEINPYVNYTYSVSIRERVSNDVIDYDELCLSYFKAVISNTVLFSFSYRF